MTATLPGLKSTSSGRISERTKSSRLSCTPPAGPATFSITRFSQVAGSDRQIRIGSESDCPPPMAGMSTKSQYNNCPMEVRCAGKTSRHSVMWLAPASDWSVKASIIPFCDRYLSQLCALHYPLRKVRSKIGIVRGGAAMMLAYRLLRLVENHSAALAAGLLEKTQNSPLLASYRNVPPGELEQRVYEIYRHLADWLLGKSELDVEKRYTEIGAKRARQDVPLSQLIWAIILTKKNLWDFLKREAVLDRPAEISGELEVEELLDEFFDHAIFYAAVGYERSRVSEPARKVSALV